MLNVHSIRILMATGPVLFTGLLLRLLGLILGLAGLFLLELYRRRRGAGGIVGRRGRLQRRRFGCRGVARRYRAKPQYYSAKCQSQHDQTAHAPSPPKLIRTVRGAGYQLRTEGQAMAGGKVANQGEVEEIDWSPD